MFINRRLYFSEDQNYFRELFWILIDYIKIGNQFFNLFQVVIFIKQNGTLFTQSCQNVNLHPSCCFNCLSSCMEQGKFPNQEYARNCVAKSMDKEICY